MKIGLISDTHGYLDPKVFEYFNEVDQVWHAGDIGTMEVLNELEAFKPTHAVYGNIDGHQLRAACPKDLYVEIEGVRILMTHIAGKPPKYNPRVLGLLRKHVPHVLICGHSHICKVEYDKSNKVLYMNPGAAGKHGFHQIKTLLRFEAKEGKIENLEVVELGKRGSLK